MAFPVVLGSQMQTALLGGGAAAWTPAQSVGNALPSLWMNADDVAGADGAAITAWASRGGHSFAQTLAGSTNLQVGSNGIGGHRAIHFNGLGGFRYAAGAISNASQGIVYAVVRFDHPLQDNEVVFASCDEGGATNYLIFRGYRSSAARFPDYIQANADTADQVQGSTTTLASGKVYILVWRSSGTAWSLRVIDPDTDAAQSLSIIGGANNGDWFGDTTLRDNFTLGLRQSSVGAGLFLKGSISEFLLYDVLLSAADETTVLTYLRQRALGDVTYELYAVNAAAAAVSTAGYLAENMVFDSVTNKYWWIFEDRSGTPATIRMASADTPGGTWTVEASPVLSAGTDLVAPFLFLDAGTWYIYYANPTAIYVQSSATVNTGYSESGITNPIIVVGGGGTWDANRVLEPCIVKVGATYNMLYMGETVGTLLEKVGLATASSPIGPFTKYGSNPVLSGDTGWWDVGQDKAADPYVFLKDGIYYVGISASNIGKATGRVGFFKTTDFLTYTPVSPNPVLDHGAIATWDRDKTIRGGVTLVGSDYYMTYTGHDVTSYRLGITLLQFNVTP